MLYSIIYFYLFILFWWFLPKISSVLWQNMRENVKIYIALIIGSLNPFYHWFSQSWHYIKIITMFSYIKRVFWVMSVPDIKWLFVIVARRKGCFTCRVCPICLQISNKLFIDINLAWHFCCRRSSVITDYATLHTDACFNW